MRVRLALLTIAVAVTVAGCGQVEQLPLTSQPGTPGASVSPEDTASSDSVPTEPSAGTPEPTDPLPTAVALPDATATPCSGADRVIAALRRDRSLLPSGVTPKIMAGPLCAGGWQYTVMNVPGREALQVVTRGSGDALTVVTAGTYVCIPEVVGAAPAGIAAAAHCR